MFGKKKEVKTGPLIVYNLNKQPVCDIDNGKFLMDFSQKQRDVLLNCLNHGLPIRSFAYKDIPGEVMQFLLDTVFKNDYYQYQFGTNFNNYDSQPSRKEMAVWAALHTKFDTISQFICQIYAIKHGMDIINDVKDDAFSHGKAVWFLLAAASMVTKGEDMYRKMTPDDEKNKIKLQRFLAPHMEALYSYEDFCDLKSLVAFYGGVQYEKFITGTVVFDYYKHLSGASQDWEEEYNRTHP